MPLKLVAGTHDRSNPVHMVAFTFNSSHMCFGASLVPMRGSGSVKDGLKILLQMPFGFFDEALRYLLVFIIMTVLASIVSCGSAGGTEGTTAAPRAAGTAGMAAAAAAPGAGVAPGSSDTAEEAGGIASGAGAEGSAGGSGGALLPGILRRCAKQQRHHILTLVEQRFDHDDQDLNSCSPRSPSSCPARAAGMMAPAIGLSGTLI